MPAANTDLLKKYLSLFSTTLSTSIGTGTSDTITPASVSGLSTDTAITITIDRVDSGGVATPTKMERIRGIISGGNLIDYVRGVDGTTEQAHTAGAVIEMVWNADDWNDMVDWALVSHNQSGYLLGSSVVASNISASAVSSGNINASAIIPGHFSAGVYATASEVATGTEDAKIVTPKAIADSYIGGALSTTTNSYGIYNTSMSRQAIIDGGCQVAQGATANLATSKAYGQVDLIYGIAEGTVGAGTITQTTSPNCGSVGTAFKLSGVTLTGSGKVKAGYRMEAKDAKKLKNQTISFSARVYHDVGSAKNYKVYINKANSSDNFSAVTNISSSTNQSVNSVTDTKVTYENVSLGDCSNGLEIIVECDCGAITTKNFEFTEFQLNRGTIVMGFACRHFDEELLMVMRYLESSYPYGTAPMTPNSSYGIAVAKVSNNTVAIGEKYNTIYFTVPKRAYPAILICPWTTPNNTGRVSNSLTGTDLASGSGTVDYYSEKGFSAYNNSGVTVSTSGYAVIYNWIADARL